MTITMNMMTHDIITVIAGLRGLNPEELSDEDHLDQLHISGIARAYCLPVKLEERFGLDWFSEAEIEKWQTIADVVKSVNKAKGKESVHSIHG